LQRAQEKQPEPVKEMEDGMAQTRQMIGGMGARRCHAWLKEKACAGWVKQTTGKVAATRSPVVLSTAMP
jgi:hypothetical protein